VNTRHSAQKPPALSAVAKVCLRADSLNIILSYSENMYSFIFLIQDNVHTNTESVQCISIVYSIVATLL